jgi:hypothetical protein
MMEEEFYSTIKLTSGEEIISKVCYLPDEDSILLDHPLKVEKVNQRKHGSHSDGFTLTEWINSTYETMFVIHRSSIITMSELDKRIENYYLRMINQDHKENNINVRPNHFSQRMGYLGSVNNTKKYLEDIFKRS